MSDSAGFTFVNVADLCGREFDDVYVSLICRRHPVGRDCRVSSGYVNN